MNLDFFEYNSLEQELKVLPISHKLAFSASCCTRLFPFYETFSEKENWGNSSILVDSLNKIWQFLEERTMNRIEFERFYENYNNRLDLFPSEEGDFFEGDNSLCTQAQETVIAISLTLEICLGITPLESALGVVKHTRDAIEYYIGDFDKSLEVIYEGISTEELGQIISEHSLVIQELGKESEDLHKLKEANGLDQDLLDWLRNSSNDQGQDMIKSFYQESK